MENSCEGSCLSAGSAGSFQQHEFTRMQAENARLIAELADKNALLAAKDIEMLDKLAAKDIEISQLISQFGAAHSDQPDSVIITVMAEKDKIIERQEQRIKGFKRKVDSGRKRERRLRTKTESGFFVPRSVRVGPDAGLFMSPTDLLGKDLKLLNSTENSVSPPLRQKTKRPWRGANEKVIIVLPGCSEASWRRHTYPRPVVDSFCYDIFNFKHLGT